MKFFLCVLSIYISLSITDSSDARQRSPHTFGSRPRCNYNELHRKDCGFPGISRRECLERGCCWDHRFMNRVWCFFPIQEFSQNQNRIGVLSGRSGVVGGPNEAANPRHNTSSFATVPLTTVATIFKNGSGNTATQEDTTFFSDEQSFLSQVHREYRNLQQKGSSTSSLIATSPAYYMSNSFSGRNLTRKIGAFSRHQEESTSGWLLTTTTTAPSPPPLLGSLKSIKNLAALLSFLKEIEKSRKKQLVPSETPRTCSGRSNDSCCRIDPTSPCCEFRGERDAVVRSSPTFRIVGGSPAGLLRHSMVHLAKLPFRNHICGGTLIDGRWVLTAAHCVLVYCHRIRSVSELIVSLGKYRKSPYTHDVGQQNIYVSDVICHPNQCKSSVEVPRLNDVALLRLRWPAIVNQYVRPAVLPVAQEEPMPFRNCFALGWGRTRGSGFDNVLKQVSVPVIPNKQCNLPGWRNCIIRSCMLCAGDINIDPCDGDSGGPLFCQRPNGVHVLHGIYSWGRCGTEVRKPSVYSRTSYFIDWINKVILRYSRRRF